MAAKFRYKTQKNESENENENQNLEWKTRIAMTQVRGQVSFFEVKKTELETNK